jgi:GntR family transcriptional regulator / MocR family aminotransferase
MAMLPIDLDRARRTPLATQIYGAIREAIETGRLASGARLPSWQDLAAQLGVSRGTVRAAYERLINEEFAIGLGAAGTRVAGRASQSSTSDWSQEAPPLPDLFREFATAPLVFQMGVPSQSEREITPPPGGHWWTSLDSSYPSNSGISFLLYPLASIHIFSV